MGSWNTKKTTNDDWADIIGTMPSLTEDQEAVSNPLSDYLAEALSNIGKQPSFEDWSKTNMPDTFTGPLAGQVEGAYTDALSGNIPDMFGGELGDQAKLAYTEALSGVAPDMFGGPLGGQAKETFQNAMTGGDTTMFGGELGSEAKSAYAEALRGEPVDYDPSGANFLQNVIPAIKESYVGSGAITGTEVGDRINRESSVMQESIANIKAGLYNQAKNRQATAAGNYQQAFQAKDEAGKNRALSAAGMYQSAYQSGQEQAKQRQLMAAGNYQQAYQNAVQYAKDRQLAGATSYQQYQLELTKIGYDNYVRQNPAATEILSSVLAYLNIPLMAAYQKPTDENGEPISGGSSWTGTSPGYNAMIGGGA